MSQAGATAIKSNDASFQKDVIESDIPVIVDFWAEWCGPCKMIAPVLDEISATMSGKVRIVKVNIDENPQTPATYGVRSIPTLILFNKGEAASVKVGAAPKGEITKWIESSI